MVYASEAKPRFRRNDLKEPLIYSANKSAPFPKKLLPLWERHAKSFIKAAGNALISVSLKYEVVNAV